MEYRNLGRTGVRVSPLCLGTMMFGPWGNSDVDDSVRIIHAALDAGINFVDTADVYSGGISEEITGRALKGRRDDVVLATKFFMPMDPDEPNHRGGSRRWIIHEVENSLRRLGTDHIDLYQVHRPSPDTDISETLGALTDLVHQGKIRYLGSSSFSGSQIVEAQWVSRVKVGESVKGRTIYAYQVGDSDASKVAVVIGQFHGEEKAGVDTRVQTAITITAGTK